MTSTLTSTSSLPGTGVSTSVKTTGACFSRINEAWLAIFGLIILIKDSLMKQMKLLGASLNSNEASLSKNPLLWYGLTSQAL